MTDKSIWDKEIPVPASVILYVDSGLVASMEPISCSQQTQSFNVRNADGYARTSSGHECH
jgi:hypothetical protein